MTEKFRFLGIEEAVEVDLDEKHVGRDFARYAFVEKRPIVEHQRDSELTTVEIIGIVGEHFYGGCLDCMEAAQTLKDY